MKKIIIVLMLSLATPVFGMDKTSSNDQEKTQLIHSLQVDKNDICSICQENFEYTESSHPVFTNPCKHYFHSDCINFWLVFYTSCPNCRKHIDTLIKTKVIDKSILTKAQNNKQCTIFNDLPFEIKNISFGLIFVGF